jgi:phospholipid-transporting ATPase
MIISELLFLLSTCHTINIENRNGVSKYSASSPDELALVNFAKYCGYEYAGTTDDGEIIVLLGEEKKKMKLLQTFEFNSDR